jgi:trehalose 6-phosphate synthase/phosphatase
MSRVVIVPNRLPVSFLRRAGEVQLQRSAGGLATGLAGVQTKSNGVWVGRPGDAADDEDCAI